jgi:hypothetical protein
MSTSAVASDPSGAQPSDLPAPETTDWVNRPLLLTSTILLVGTYLPVAIVGMTSDRSRDQTNLFIPVVGPWLNYANRECDVKACTHETANKTLLVLDGIGQGIGALGIVTSFFLPNKTTRHWYLIGSERSVIAAPARVGIAGYGLGAVGRF